MSALAVSDLRPVGGEPRVLDVRVGERLGMAQPRDIRRVIRDNEAEMARYGSIRTQRAQIAGAGRPGVAYHLTEGQALLLVMFSRTERAADVRQEVIEAFMAWRRGATAPRAAQSATAFAAARARAEDVAATLAALNAAAPEVRMITHLPLWGSGRRPKFWRDIAVRTLLTETHRQMPMGDVRALCLDRFGPARTPSMSAVHRYWMLLDKARCGAGRGAGRA